MAKQGRISTISANGDDLDEFLAEVARATGQLMLLELDEATAKRIAGEGAVWPALSREDVISEIFLTVKAGSSGRPNKAAEIAHRERAFPFIVQLPGSDRKSPTSEPQSLLRISYAVSCLKQKKRHLLNKHSH